MLAARPNEEAGEILPLAMQPERCRNPGLRPAPWPAPPRPSDLSTSLGCGWLCSPTICSQIGLWPVLQLRPPMPCSSKPSPQHEVNPKEIACATSSANCGVLHCRIRQLAQPQPQPTSGKALLGARRGDIRPCAQPMANWLLCWAGIRPPLHPLNARGFLFEPFASSLPLSHNWMPCHRWVSAMEHF